MAYSDTRRATVAALIEQYRANRAPVTFYARREADGTLDPATRKVTNLVLLRVVGARNLGQGRGYVLTVRPVEGGEAEQIGPYTYDGQTFGIGGGQTVWTTHPKGGHR